MSKITKEQYKERERKEKIKERMEWKIRSKFPIFSWAKCDCCEDYFRREKIWAFEGEYFYNVGSNYRYILPCGYYCKNCCPTKEDVYRKVYGEEPV